jgi:hypothetical protein
MYLTSVLQQPEEARWSRRAAALLIIYPQASCQVHKVDEPTGEANHCLTSRSRLLGLRWQTNLARLGPSWGSDRSKRPCHILPEAGSAISYLKMNGGG